MTPDLSRTEAPESQPIVCDFVLKVDPSQLAAIVAGTKTHEVRVFERNYQVGSILKLLAYDRATPSTGNYTGAQAIVKITNITAPDTYGLPANVGVMSIALLSKIEA